jgi:carboxyl-terminal processing protease
MNNDFDRTPEELDGKNIKVENAVDEKTSIFKDKRFKIALVALVVALSLVFSVMTTFTLTKRHYEEMLVKAYLDVLTSGGDELGELDAFFQKYSYYELDSEELIEEALRAYIKATGDRYARYYNAEEYAAMQQERTGVNVGIGVNMEYSKNDGAIRITRVMNGSPAEKSGLKAGDLIVEVTLDDGRRGFVHEFGYEESIAALGGEPGDIASFVVKRGGLSSAPSYIEFSIVLEQYLTDTVDYKVSSTDPSVGIIMITKFDLFTPMLFKEAMTELKKSGINKIVFDVRNNLG